MSGQQVLDKWKKGQTVKYRLLGRTGVWVSEISLGTMTFGGKSHPMYQHIGGLGQEEVDRVVGTALEAGINFIDTADAYADGESEELLGQAIGQRRREVVLATKLLAPVGPGPNDQGLTRLHIMRALEDSLRRLRTDYIDPLPAAQLRSHHAHRGNAQRARRRGPAGQGPLHREL
jgi:aryl-alcohol dehydrogenase-like predicted oxidoreductase